MVLFSFIFIFGQHWRIAIGKGWAYRDSRSKWVPGHGKRRMGWCFGAVAMQSVSTLQRRISSKAHPAKSRDVICLVD